MAHPSRSGYHLDAMPVAAEGFLPTCKRMRALIGLSCTTVLAAWVAALLLPFTPPIEVEHDTDYLGYERFLGGARVSGQILCLELPLCHITLGTLPTVIRVVDASNLSVGLQEKILSKCILSSQWGCPAWLTIYPSAGYVLRLKEISWIDLNP
jgi:hypothetical protein